MEKRVQSLQEWDEGLRQRLEELHEYRIARNAAVPINARLPPEIIGRIFAQYQYLQYTDDNGRGYRWLRPAHVCHYWRELAMANALFWQRITLMDKTSPGCLDEVLKRSGNAPLIVAISLRNLKNETWLARLDKVLAELPRMQSLLVKNDHEAMLHVLNALDIDTPLLSDLSLISLHSRSYAYPEFKLRSLEQISLLDLSFFGVTLENTKHLLTQNLRELDITLNEVPEPGHLQSALGGMPQLEALRITTHHAQDPDSVFVERPISMPRMHSVRFIGSVLTCAFLLNSLALPMYCALHIDCAPVDEISTDFERDCTPLGSALATKCWHERAGDTRPLVNIMINATSSRLTLSGWRESDVIKLWAQGFHRRMLIVTVFAEYYNLETLFSSFGILPKAQVLVLGDFITSKAPRLAQVQNVEALSIAHEEAVSTHILLNVLQERASQLPPTLLFPKLRTLYLSSIIFDEKWKLDRDAQHWRPPRRFLDPLTGTMRPVPATLSLECLKATLEVRKRENLPLCSLVLTKPIGLVRKNLEIALRGLVENVKWDGETIDMSANTAPIMPETKDPSQETTTSTNAQVEDANTENVLAREDRIVTTDVTITTENGDSDDEVGWSDYDDL